MLPWCINTGKSLIPLTLRFLAQKRNLLIPLELSRVMHQGTKATHTRKDSFSPYVESVSTASYLSMSDTCGQR